MFFKRNLKKKLCQNFQQINFLRKIFEKFLNIKKILIDVHEKLIYFKENLRTIQF